MTDDELYEEIHSEVPVSDPSASLQKPKHEKPVSLIEQLTTIGTPACALFCAAIGIVIAALLLIAGFWKTLFILVMGVIGAFIGGVPKKSEWLKNLINRAFPPKH